MARETVRGRGITVHFDGERCIHSRNCVLMHPDVFVPNVEGEWIRPDAVSADEVALAPRDLDILGHRPIDAGSIHDAAQQIRDYERERRA